MASQSEYFAQQAQAGPKLTYHYGDRVMARLGPIPLVGMVIRESAGQVLIHSDLPLKIEDQLRHIVSVSKTTVKRLVDMSGSCSCGRTLDPNGDCDTSHALTQAQYQKMIKRRNKT